MARILQKEAASRRGLLKDGVVPASAVKEVAQLETCGTTGHMSEYRCSTMLKSPKTYYIHDTYVAVTIVIRADSVNYLHVR